MRYRCDSKLSLQAALTDIQAQFGKTGYLDIRTSGKRRSLDQNALFHVWCEEIAQAREENEPDITPEAVKSEIKLRKGFSLLRRMDEVTDEILKLVIDPLMVAGGWERAMHLASGIDCTSKMDAASLSALLEWMQLQMWNDLQIRLEAK